MEYIFIASLMGIIIGLKGVHIHTCREDFMAKLQGPFIKDTGYKCHKVSLVVIGQ